MGGAGLVALAVGTIMFYAGWTDRSPLRVFKALLAGQKMDSVTPRHISNYGPLVPVGSAQQQQQPAPVNPAGAQQAAGAAQGAAQEAGALASGQGTSSTYQALQQWAQANGETLPAGSQNWTDLQWSEYQLSIEAQLGPLQTASGLAQAIAQALGAK